MNATAVFGIGAASMVILGALFAAVRWSWPRLAWVGHSVVAMFETFNGKPEVIDRAGRVVEPAEPSLRVQLADIHTIVSDQSQQNTRLTANEAGLADHAHRLDDHTHRLTRLEEAHIERVAGRLDSAAAWNAMEAIANQPAGDPPETIEEHNL